LFQPQFNIQTPPRQRRDLPIGFDASVCGEKPGAPLAALGVASKKSLVIFAKHKSFEYTGLEIDIGAMLKFSVCSLSFSPPHSFEGFFRGLIA
jgi:hypothetical protein